MQIFYTTNIVDDKILIDQQEHIHLSKVLRKKVGDEVFVCNGTGLMLRAEIIAISKRESVLLTKEVLHQLTKNSNRLYLAVAPTKNMDRYEWMLEKSIEIGLKGLIPFYSQNSERRKLKMERLHAIAIAAMKQSKSLFLPEISEAITFSKHLDTLDMQNKYIAYVEEETTAVKQVFPSLDNQADTVVLIGPEGGFTKEEVALAKSKGFIPISLGKKRLRTETAGVFTATAFQLLCP